MGHRVYESFCTNPQSASSEKRPHCRKTSIIRPERRDQSRQHRPWTGLGYDLVLGLDVVERSIDRSELYLADEAFFTGTGAQVASITEVDHRQLGEGKIGPLTRQIQELYFQTVRGNNERYAHLVTPVYPR